MFYDDSPRSIEFHFFSMCSLRAWAIAWHRLIRAALRQSIKASMAMAGLVLGWYQKNGHLGMIDVTTFIIYAVLCSDYIVFSTIYWNVWNELSRVIRVVDGLFTTWAWFMALGLPHEPAWPSRGRIEPIPSRESWYQLLGSDWLPSFMLDPYNTNLTL